MNKSLFALAFLLSLTPCLRPSSTLGMEASPTIVLSARYQPGDTCDDCFAWRVTILENGVVSQHVKKVPGWDAADEWVQRPVSSLTQRQMRRLLAILEEVRFGELEQNYSATYLIDDATQAWRVVTCQDTVTIEARVGTGLNRVKVYGPEEVAGIDGGEHLHPARDAGRRFCRVWGEVLHFVGSPNDWQRAGPYR